jgi:hypothetical protein
MLWLLAASLLAGPPAAPDPVRTLQAQEYRPVSLGDLVKSVGENRDGLEGEVDLAPFVADHATFAGEAVGFAARVRDDPDGPIFVAWRRPGELWIYDFLDDYELTPVREIGEAGLRLGRVGSLRSFGPHLVLETRGSASPTSSVVMRRDLTPVAHVRGSATLALPSGAIVLQRTQADGDRRNATLALLDPDTRRVTPFYTARSASISSVELDAATDTLTFTVSGVAPGQEPARVTCRPMSQASRACVSE